MRKAIDTAVTSVPPCGLIVTDCLSPWVRRSRWAVNPAPATFTTISAPLARTLRDGTHIEIAVVRFVARSWKFKMGRGKFTDGCAVRPFC